MFYAIDSWFVPEQQSRGVITGRSYSPAQMILVPITSGVPPNTTTIMMPQHIPESWSVGVRVGKRTGSMCVNESYYDRAQRGQDVMVHYVSGRLSSKMYVKGLS